MTEDPFLEMNMPTRLEVNDAGRIIGNIPDLTADKDWRCGRSSPVPASDVRVIKAGFTLAS
jgi:hypothetical protein